MDDEAVVGLVGEDTEVVILKGAPIWLEELVASFGGNVARCGDDDQGEENQETFDPTAHVVGRALRERGFVWNERRGGWNGRREEGRLETCGAICRLETGTTFCRSR